MAATVENFLIKGCIYTLKRNIPNGFKDKLYKIGMSYSTLKAFKKATIEHLESLTTQDGEKLFKKLTQKEIEAIISLQKEIDPKLTLEENFIQILTKTFLRTQIEKVSSLNFENFNANPILCKALNLTKPEEFITFNAYQSVGRSIVTSMGFLIQDYVLYCNSDIFAGKNYKEGAKTKFDIVIERMGQIKSYLEIKSGFNDMDKAQIQHYAEEIREVENKGFLGFIGIAYGRKDSKTVTAVLLETHLEDWRNKTLVGKELWDFASGQNGYHNILLTTIEGVAKALFKKGSLEHMIEDKIKDLIKDFYQSGETGACWDSMGGIKQCRNLHFRAGRQD